MHDTPSPPCAHSTAFQVFFCTYPCAKSNVSSPGLLPSVSGLTSAATRPRYVARKAAEPSTRARVCRNARPSLLAHPISPQTSNRPTHTQPETRLPSPIIYLPGCCNSPCVSLYVLCHGRPSSSCAADLIHPIPNTPCRTNEIQNARPSARPGVCSFLSTSFFSDFP